MTTPLNPIPQRVPEGLPEAFRQWMRSLLRSLSLIVERVRVVDIAPAKITSGTGTPENNVVGNVGDLFLRTDGGTNTTLYVKESGTSDTGWSAV